MEGSVSDGAVRERERERERDVLRGGRSSKRNDSDTQENIHMSQVGERKESI
jgi:hypothetical protein